MEIGINIASKNMPTTSAVSLPKISDNDTMLNFSRNTFGNFCGLDFTFPQSCEMKSQEERASKLYEEASNVAKAEGRALNIFDLDRIRSAKIKNNPNDEDITIDELIEQSNIDYDYINALSESGLELTPQQVRYKKEIRPLIAQLRNGKISVKEFNEKKRELLTESVKDKQKEIVHKDDTTLTQEQIKSIGKLYSDTAETDIVTFKVAKIHSKNNAQKIELETAFVEEAPKLRTAIVKEAVKELPKSLDENSIKEYTKATETLEIKERNYASAIIKNADYLTEEQKEQKLEIIGKNPEEILKITKENTKRLTEQIIEYRKEQEFVKQKENYKAQIVKQENIKEEHKLNEFKKAKLENKESNFKKIFEYLLAGIKKTQNENKNDKKSQDKIEHAKFMKAKLEKKMSDIQSKKHMLEQEMEINEVNNTLALSDMQDDYIRYSSCFSIIH